VRFSLDEGRGAQHTGILSLVVESEDVGDDFRAVATFKIFGTG
jgi:hypothetical protein